MSGLAVQASVSTISVLRNIIFTTGNRAEEVAYRDIITLERVPSSDTGVFPGARVIVATGADVSARPPRRSCLPTEIDGIAVDIRLQCRNRHPIWGFRPDMPIHPCTSTRCDVADRFPNRWCLPHRTYQSRARSQAEIPDNYLLRERSPCHLLAQQLVCRCW